MLSLPSDVKELVPEFYSNDPSFLVGGWWRRLGMPLAASTVASMCSRPAPLSIYLRAHAVRQAWEPSISVFAD